MLKELGNCGIGVKLGVNLLISVLAFADDIIFLAESANDLQKLIDIVYRWSTKWRFMVNPDKSQVVHYRNAPKLQTDFIFQLHYDGPILDEYLTFAKVTPVLATAGGQALGAMINKYKSLDALNYDTCTKESRATLACLYRTLGRFLHVTIHI